MHLVESLIGCGAESVVAGTPCMDVVLEDLNGVNRPLHLMPPLPVNLECISATITAFTKSQGREGQR